MNKPALETEPQSALDAAALAAPLPPTTTSEQNLRTASQREVNLIWERTQMRLALSVIWASLFVAAAIAVFGKYIGTAELQLAAVVFLFGVANLVTGFYFGRTNHARIGDEPGPRSLDDR